MRQNHPTSGAEPDAECPVSLDELGELYRADDYDLSDLLAALSVDTRSRLAAYCYRKSHTHQLALRIARSCERDDLVRVAGEVGAVIYGQAHLEPALAARRPAENSSAPAMKISLGGSAAKGRRFDW